MTDTTTHARTSPSALLSLAFGLAAPLTVGITSLPALFLGYVALRQINLSDGRLRGRRAAGAGLALGVAGVVVFAVGLVLIALAKARANSEETVCKNNLRRVGVAVNLYHDEYKHYPPGTAPVDGLPPERRLSWQATILPFLDPANGVKAGHQGTDLYAKLDLGKAWDAAENRAAATTRLSWYLCPARVPIPGPGEPGPTEYLGIAGLGEDAARLPKEDARAGFFGYDRRISRADLTRGQSATMAASESATAGGPWAAGGAATVRSVLAEEKPYVGPGRPFGGLHAGGSMSVFADSRVQFVREGISPAVWEAHATIRADEP